WCFSWPRWGLPRRPRCPWRCCGLRCSWPSAWWAGWCTWWGRSNDPWSRRRPKMDLSVVVPIKDERDNLGPLHERVRQALDPLRLECEIVLVDDGSSDGSFPVMERLAAEDARVKVVRLRRNFGQSAALQAGIDHSTGDVIATMDGDLQNDPADIPMLSEKLKDDYDAFLGERAKRQDGFLIRKIPNYWRNLLNLQVTCTAF